MTALPDNSAAANRSAFLAGALAVLGVASPASASATPGSPPPGFAPVPPSALGPALNADGYFAGQINGNLYWVTDSFYQAMFLTTRDGVVLIDAPPTIGRNLLRAIEAITSANGMPSTVTHLVYSHSHADHIGASSLFGVLAAADLYTFLNAAAMLDSLRIDAGTWDPSAITRRPVNRARTTAVVVMLQESEMPPA
jgi:glyoxylase-like metal-dependent hydrolase (beta-lactamase superfamily II)